MKLSIHNGRVIDPASNSEHLADLMIEGDRIVAIGKSLKAADKSIDASNCIVCPGLVELGGHINVRQTENSQSLRATLLAASRAGITTLCFPAPDIAEVAARMRYSINHTGIVRPVLLAPMSRQDEKLTAMAALRNAGCIGVTDIGKAIVDTCNLKRAMEYALSCGLKLFFHPVEPFLAAGGVAAEGEQATRLGLRAIPAAAEAIAIGRIMALLEDIPATAHFCRVSSARAVKLIAAARADGLPVTADVALPYLYLNSGNIPDYDANYLLSPPLRHEEDRLALRAALANGTLTALCADHHHVDDSMKALPFPAAAAGMRTWGMLLPALLHFAGENSMTLAAALATVTTGPASVLGIGQKRVAEGEVADLCIFDTAAKTEQHKLLPQQQFSGRVTHTIRAGRVING